LLRLQPIRDAWTLIAPGDTIVGLVAYLYPLMVDLSGRLVVIVGGGNVGTRKAIGLLEAGAGKVRVVSPQYHTQMPANVEKILAEYEPHHLEGATLVFAATDRALVNAKVVTDARERGILVNRADSEEADFSTPALLREGPVTIAVATGGSPAIAAKIRDGIKETLDRRWIALAEVMQKLRPMVLAASIPEEKRRELFRELASVESADLAKRGDVAALEAKVKAHLAASA